MFEVYKHRLNNNTYKHNVGATPQQKAILNNAIQVKENTFTDGIGYTEVEIDGQKKDSILIENRADGAKSGAGDFFIQFRYGEPVYQGMYIDIPDTHLSEDSTTWILLQRSKARGFKRHLIAQCNYTLKWKNHKGEIISRQVIIDDDYKITDGTIASKGGTRLPSSVIPIIMPLDDETKRLRRDDRFLIDVLAKGEGFPDAYIVNHRHIIPDPYDKTKGLINLVVAHHQFNPQTDNQELMVADYYHTQESVDELGKVGDTTEVKLQYVGKPTISVGGAYKKFSLVGEGVNAEDIVYELLLPDELKKVIDYKTQDGVLYIKAALKSAAIGLNFKIKAQVNGTDQRAELLVKVVSNI